ncbi:4Fe-4S binding protein [Desulfovibrio sp. OttesenSCG-928-F20]|nr:4Fe-4S binding protein [Desulfovibrio sp. OttesenSCG-928-F20]
MFMTKTIIGNLLKKYSTRLHPFEQRVLPDGYRGRFKFVIDKCIMCRQCAIKCPTQVIRIEPEKGIWEREVMGCLYCGVCADVCPTGCLTMTNVYRPPITEPAFLKFNVKPRPAKKSKTDEAPTPKQVQEAIAAKAAEDAENKPSVSKVAATEEQAAKPVSEVRKEKAKETKPSVSVKVKGKK